MAAANADQAEVEPEEARAHAEAGQAVYGSGGGVEMLVLVWW